MLHVAVELCKVRGKEVAVLWLSLGRQSVATLVCKRLKLCIHRVHVVDGFVPCLDKAVILALPFAGSHIFFVCARVRSWECVRCSVYHCAVVCGIYMHHDLIFFHQLFPDSSARTEVGWRARTNIVKYSYFFNFAGMVCNERALSEPRTIPLVLDGILRFRVLECVGTFA